MKRPHLLGLGLAALISSIVSPTLGQPAGKPNGGDARTSGDPTKREEAKQHFHRGIDLFAREMWDAALAEFLRSREIYPSRGATKNAAYCLSKLRRFDEALDMYEAVIALPDATPQDRTFAEEGVREVTPLVGFIEIQDAEPGSTVTVDGRERGEVASGPIRVTAGTRTVRVQKPGFAVVDKRVDVSGQQTVAVQAQMTSLTAPPQIVRESVRALPPGPERREWGLELASGLVVAPSLGGDVAGKCAEPCQVKLGLGALIQVHAGYELANGLTPGISMGYLALGQSVAGRPATISPSGAAPNMGSEHDALALSGLLAGLTGAYHHGKNWPVTFRLGAGVLLGAMRDERSGTYTSSGKQSYSRSSEGEATARYAYLSPEVRVGVAFLDRFELSAGVQALMLFAFTKPTVAPQSFDVDDGAVDGYGGGDLSAGVLILIEPGLALRAAF